ncbi:GNAT family N-acetyltransferase [Siccirubricoccus phaeus]|uniref:GNAT family N-acetyltransferase n=1 Tax=Siccirubricoccus phaeus TaxID=2595053 RepID=UPI0011F26796|nr:GNAT family N-acetyltransferase [Siccirubricoccus phaeus]
MERSILAVSQRPELAPLVARWRVEAFFHHPGGCTVEEMTGWILAPPVGPEDNFVLFEGERPVGTAGLVQQDLETRPDLTPWLAGLFVLPECRGRGHGAALVRQVEGFARRSGVPVLWLYTLAAEPFYLRLGWARAGIERERDHEVILMRRPLIGAGRG